MDNIPDIDNMFTLRSYEELEKIINDWLNGSEEDDEEDNSSRGGSFPNNKTPQKENDDSPDNVSSKYKSLDDAFADLEGDATPF